MKRRALGVAAGVALGALGACWASMAGAEGQVMPTHVCNPRMGDNNDRQAFIGFADGSVQWCMSRNQCNKLDGMPAAPSPIVGFSCERELFVWVIRADGQVYRCGGAIGRKACERVPIQP